MISENESTQMFAAGQLGTTFGVATAQNLAKRQKACASDKTGTSKHTLGHQLRPQHLANNMPHTQGDTKGVADQIDTQEKDNATISEPQYL